MRGFEWPDEPIEGIERVILHWTAGSHFASPLDREHYHILIEHDEGPTDNESDDEIHVVEGVPIDWNAGQVSGQYAAHTRGFNSGSLGLVLCGMRGAVDRRSEGGKDVDPGPSPISTRQVEVMVTLIVQFCTIWSFLPTEERVFTHFEAQELHGVQQRGKWDIGWLPGYFLVQRDVGPWIRRKVSEAMG